jgi:tyrosine-protein phosphatase YwqE
MEFRTDLPALLEKHGTNLSLGGGRFLFVTLPALQVPLEAEEVWSKISARGFSILLSRPECSLALRRDSLRLERWIKSGVKLQLDAASITGMHGQEIQHFALQCLKKYEGHVILASGTGGECARPASLASAREELLKKNQSHKVRRLLQETPEAMIGEGAQILQEDAKRAFRFWQLLRLRSHRAVPDES